MLTFFLRFPRRPLKFNTFEELVMIEAQQHIQLTHSRHHMCVLPLLLLLPSSLLNSSQRLHYHRFHSRCHAAATHRFDAACR